MFPIRYFVIFVVWMLGSVVGQDLTETDLLAKLFSNYNVNARPVATTRTSLNVTATFFLTSFEVGEQFQEFKLRGWFYLEWKDAYLSWNESEYSIPKLILSPSLVWLPDLSILNAKNDRTLLQKSISPVAVFSWGLVAWSPEVVLTTSCPISVTYYPFDTQNCFIQITPWYSEPIEQMLWMGADEVMVDTLEDNTEWEYIGSSVNPELMEPFKQSSWKLSLQIKRRPFYQIVHTFIPTVLLSYMNCFVFILPISSGETTSFGVAIFLAFAVFIGPVKESLPETSTETCYFTVYLIFQFCLGGLETCMSCLTLRLASRTTSVNAKSWWIILGDILLIRNQRNGKVYPGRTQGEVKNEEDDSHNESDRISHIADFSQEKQDISDSCDMEFDWLCLAERLNMVLLVTFVVINTMCLVFVLLTIA